MIDRAVRPTLLVLAGVNGAGKSSVAGARLRASGLDYYNPDEATRSLRDQGMVDADANAAAWRFGKQRLEDAIGNGRGFAFETTLGGNTMPALIRQACDTHDVTVWFVGLDTPERHLARVQARVAAGGHAIAEHKIRERWDAARRNLIGLLPHLHELRVYDNSVECRQGADGAEPAEVLHCRDGRMLQPVADQMRGTPDWAKPLVEAASRLDPAQ